MSKKDFFLLSLPVFPCFSASAEKKHHVLQDADSDRWDGWLDRLTISKKVLHLFPPRLQRVVAMAPLPSKKKACFEVKASHEKDRASGGERAKLQRGWQAPFYPILFRSQKIPAEGMKSVLQAGSFTGNVIIKRLQPTLKAHQKSDGIGGDLLAEGA